MSFVSLSSSSKLYDRKSAIAPHVEASPPSRSSLQQKSLVQRAIKRLMDISLSACALVVLSPVFLVIWAIIRLESPGPGMFIQKRWGRNQRQIDVYKFRTMRTDEGDASGVAQTVANDPRLTRIGKLLRKSNLDELPQLLNVLLGSMSLVGPRCHPIGMLAGGVQYEELVPRYHDRHLVRPGLTGIAQVKGLRGPTVDAARAVQRIEADLFYVQNYSVWLDIKLIVKTVSMELRGGTGS
ncbi:MAG: sugar transferase [Mesorhizobium sp.]|nr:sugar transferase [Mesorhizobium sp.]MBL8576239.1 sugar transferase [Mesorhizobium sp.]